MLQAELICVRHPRGKLELHRSVVASIKIVFVVTRFDRRSGATSASKPLVMSGLASERGGIPVEYLGIEGRNAPGVSLPRVDVAAIPPEV